MEYNVAKGKFCFDTDLINRIKEYMRENVHLQKYEICSVMQYEHPEDYYLYKVLCRNTKDNTYTYWSTWNDSIGGLYHGHYGLDYNTAMRDYLER